jgi:hypothetical protein
MATRHQAWNTFRATRENERALYGAAEAYRGQHGRYPDEYLQAQQATTRAWAAYLDTPARDEPHIDRHPWALGQELQLTYDQAGEIDWERALAGPDPEAEI